MPSDTDPSGKLSEEATSVLKDGILVLVSVVLSVWLGWHYFGERSVIVVMLDTLVIESIVKEEGWYT